MEFTISTETLKSEVNLLQSIAEQKSGVAALASILIESTETGVRLIATDLDVTLQTDIVADVKTEGNVCIPAKKLYDIVKSLDSGTIKFKKDANDWVRITCNTSKFRVTGFSRDNFPNIPDIEANEVVLDGDTVKSMIKHTSFAITQEESRYALSGAKLEIAEGKVTLVATDGHRVALVEETIDDTEAVLEVLIPKRALAEISKFVGNELVIKDSPNHLKFESGDRVLICRKLAMNFPNYKMALPKDNNIKVSFDAEEMVKALKRVGIMADERNRATEIKLEETRMVLSASVQGESEEIVNCTVENYPKDGLAINLNWNYLLDFIQNCDAPRFQFKDKASAVEVIDGNSIYIQMPLRAN